MATDDTKQMKTILTLPPSTPMANQAPELSGHRETWDVVMNDKDLRSPWKSRVSHKVNAKVLSQANSKAMAREITSTTCTILDPTCLVPMRTFTRVRKSETRSSFSP